MTGVGELNSRLGQAELGRGRNSAHSHEAVRANHDTTISQLDLHGLIGWRAVVRDDARGNRACAGQHAHAASAEAPLHQLGGVGIHGRQDALAAGDQRDAAA